MLDTLRQSPWLASDMPPEVSPMNVDGTEDGLARLANWAEECRERYRRIKEAGDQVTEAEKVAGRASYEACLEQLSRFLADRRRSCGKTH